MHFLILIAGAALFCFAPLWLQAIIAVIDTLIPDPIPWLDEILMWAVVVGRVLKCPPKVPLRRK